MFVLKFLYVLSCIKKIVKEKTSLRHLKYFWFGFDQNLYIVFNRKLASSWWKLVIFWIRQTMAGLNLPDSNRKEIYIKCKKTESLNEAAFDSNKNAFCVWDFGRCSFALTCSTL
jgi:hypothetical protein